MGLGASQFEEIFCTHLFPYIDIDELIMLYFVNSTIRAKLGTKEALHCWSLNFGLVLDFTAVAPTSLWKLIEEYDNIFITCRSYIVQQYLFSNVKRALIRGDNETINTYTGLGCDCTALVCIAMHRNLDIDYVMKGVVIYSDEYTDLFRRNREEGSLYTKAMGEKFLINYREVVFLIRNHPDLKACLQCDINTDLVGKVLLALLLSRDEYSLTRLLDVGLSRDVFIKAARHHNYSTIMMTAKLCNMCELDMITVITDLAEDSFWESCIRWANCYETLFYAVDYTPYLYQSKD